MRFFITLVLLFIFLCSCNSQVQQNNTKNNEEKIRTIEADKNGKVVLTKEEWQKKLTTQQYDVLRQKGTERPFKNKYFNSKSEGVYKCGACGNPLFSSTTKFKSGTGWPSFFQAIKKNVGEIKDKSYGMVRVEVICNRCDSHLGHLFNDGPKPTGQRYCINSAALQLDKKKKLEDSKKESNEK